MKKIFSYFIISTFSLIAAVLITVSCNSFSNNLKPTSITYTKLSYEFPTFTVINNQKDIVEKTSKNKIIRKKENRFITFKKIKKNLKLSTVAIKSNKRIDTLIKIKIKNKLVHNLSTRFQIVEKRKLIRLVILLERKLVEIMYIKLKIQLIEDNI